DHVLGHQDRDEFVAVVDVEGQPDELRKDRRAARPGADHLVASRAARLLRLLQQITVDKGSLPYRAGHPLPPIAPDAAGRSAGRSICSAASSCPWSACPTGSPGDARPKSAL